MALHHEYDLIPKGELKCIWMEAGIVDYKLCDLQLRCDKCPFDSVIRQQLWTTEPGHSSTSPESTSSSKLSTRPTEEYVERQLQDLFSGCEEVSLPSDRSYSSNHLCFRKNDALSVTVGLDHLALHLIGPISGVAYTTPPTRAYATSPCAWIIHRNGTFPLRIPVAGTITQVNKHLTDSPQLVCTSPYEDGWILSFKPDLGDGVHERLLPHDQAAKIFRTQLKDCREDCRVALLKRHPPVGATMYDGGQPVDRIESILGPAAFLQIVLRRLFVV